MSWFVYAIAAQVFYTISTFIDRFLIEKRVKDAISLSVIGGLTSLLVGFAVLLFRGFPGFPPEQIILAIAGGALFEAALFPYYKAIAIDDPSRIVPFFQTIPLFALGLSFVFLGESLSSYELMGFLLILIGSFALAVKKIDWGIFKLRRSFWFMIAASGLVGVGLVVFKFVVDIQGFWDTLGYEYLGAGFGAFALYFSPFRKIRFSEVAQNIDRGTAGVIGLNELLWVAARFSTFFASSLVPVSLVAISGGVQPLFIFVGGTALSIWFPNILKEDLDKSVVKLKIAAIILVFLGVWLINI